MSEFKSKEDKLFIENYIRLQRRLGKGVIANVNPENEIYKGFRGRRYEKFHLFAASMV